MTQDVKVPEDSAKLQYEPPRVIFDADLDGLAREMGPAQACRAFVIPGVGELDITGIFSE
jgi:hypothetical protein